MGYAADVIFHLMNGYFGKGYILCMDNFYNSADLTDVLSSKQMYVCGTLTSNKRRNPKKVVKLKLKRGEVVWRRKEYGTKWKDKRDVLTISNMHQVEIEEVRNRNEKV